jgi:hypothetical protein
MTPKLSKVFLIKEARTCAEGGNKEENDIEVKAKDAHIDVVGPEAEHDIDEAAPKLDPKLEKIVDDYAKVLTMKAGIKGVDPKALERIKDVLREFSVQIESAEGESPSEIEA